MTSQRSIFGLCDDKYYDFFLRSLGKMETWTKCVLPTANVLLQKTADMVGLKAPNAALVKFLVACVFYIGFHTLLLLLLVLVVFCWYLGVSGLLVGLVVVGVVLLPFKYIEPVHD